MDKASAQDEPDHSKVVQVDHGENHIDVANNKDEHIVRIDAGNDNHICVVHDSDGKIVEVENRSSHILINTHGSADSDDCATTIQSSTQPTPTPQPTCSPDESPSPKPTQTPDPTSTPTASPTPSISPSPTIVTASAAIPSSDKNILAASTMAPTGNAWTNLGHILEILGLSLAAIGALAFVKSKKLFSK